MEEGRAKEDLKYKDGFAYFARAFPDFFSGYKLQTCCKVHARKETYSEVDSLNLLTEKYLKDQLIDKDNDAISGLLKAFGIKWKKKFYC